MLVRAFSKLGLNNAYLVLAGPDDGQLEEVKEIILQLNLQNKVVITGLFNRNRGEICPAGCRSFCAAMSEGYISIRYY